MIVDLAAAEEEIGVGMELSYWVFHFGAEEEIFLAADVAFVDGIGAANFKGRAEQAEAEKGKIGTGGDAEVLAALKIGEGTGGCRQKRRAEASGFRPEWPARVRYG